MKNDGSVLLETRGLTAGYEKKIVLQGVELSVRAGEVLALIGPNGAGKSTFIKSIAGQLVRSGGTVFLCGKDLRQMTPGERSERMSVLLTGQPAGELVTCREMAAAGRYPYTGRLGILSPEDWEKVDAAMTRMGAADLADLPFDGISDGQRQRVLLARALCQEPKVLVLDEPASFLDIRYQLELVAALRSLAEQEDLAVIISLHELDLVRRCADRILCLKGRPGGPAGQRSGDFRGWISGAAVRSAGGQSGTCGAGTWEVFAFIFGQRGNSCGAAIPPVPARRWRRPELPRVC